jgi:hypothetical protein
LAILFTLLSAVCLGQKVAFEINAPNVVGRSEVFKVEFTVEANGRDFSAPDFPGPGFDVIAGPTPSQGRMRAVINGNISQTVNTTITYVLQSRGNGKFTIPSASIVVDGKTYSTRPFAIEVVENEGGDRKASGGEGATPTKLGRDDLFVTVTVDKSSVYKGQPIKATFKLYSRGIPNTIEGYKFPTFNGFWSQDLGSGEARTRKESYRNKIYDVRILKETLLYPQQSGALYIEQFDLNVLAQVMVTRRGQQSIFDNLLGGGYDIEPVHKKLTAGPVRINVNELPPGAPKSFAGAVGSFTMECDPPKPPVMTNSSASVAVKISGTGNLPLIQLPRLDLPASIEQYNTSTTEQLNPSSSGISGHRRFEFPFIARAEGEYTIPPIEFSYFSPEQMRYVTLSSGPIPMRVLPDSSGVRADGGGGVLMNALSKEDVKILGEDIRFIKLGSPGLKRRGEPFFGSWPYVATLLGLVALFVAALVYLRKYNRNIQNASFVRGKRASKVALARLRAARTAMSHHDRRGFYEEILKALWGYAGDKLDIPVANLTKETLCEGLAARGIAAAEAERYANLISECEYTRYSPDVKGHTMDDAYDDAVEIISSLEGTIKR